MMDTIAPLLLFVLFSGTVFYVFVPFLGPIVLATGDEAATNTLARELRKISLYKQLREVEFEQEMGLVDGHDFARIRADLMEEVAGVMQSTQSASEASPGPGAVAAAENCPSCGAETDSDGRFCSQCGTELGAGCPNCGARVQLHDQFCGHCGRGLVSSS